MEGYGETLSNRDNRIWLSPDKTDPLGIPTINIAMESSPTQNPSLTYMALTARAANHAVEQLKRGKL